MVLNEKIKIITSNKNIGYYNNLGYDVKSGDEIEIFYHQLPFRSRVKIKVECDNCHRQLEIQFGSYNRNIENDNFYYCNKCSSIKSKKTFLEKYGVNHQLKIDSIKEKIKTTCLEKYGFDSSSKNNDVKEKIKKTCLEKYGETSFMKTQDFKILSKEKYIEMYGVDHPLKNKEIKEKIKNTCLEKYGVSSPLESDIIKEKIKNTKIEKYGDENYNNRNKYKNTCLEIFGFENAMSNIDVQNKLKKSIFEKYGVEYPSQSEEIYEKMLKNGYKIKKYEELYYQGTYELNFLEKYYNIGITRCKPIKYQFNNTIHIYFPDFYYEPLNLIIEIKSSKWYDEHLSKNLSKQKACQNQGYNFIFIIDKNYEIFDKLIKHKIYDKGHSWQYDLRLNSEDDVMNELKINDFIFEYVPETNKKICNDIKDFIKKYEWLGKMPNRPTHRFIAKYNDKLAGVVIFATPNSFSKLLGDDTHKIEKLISRGASAAWTPKNLASSLIMWSINWIVKNTKFRLFCAYSDPESKELGTIYQACNFTYLGMNFGGDMVYFDLNKPHLGWFSNRNFHRRSVYKKLANEMNIEITWKRVGEIPLNLKKLMNEKIDEYKKTCISRKSSKKHKYIYLLGKDKKETKLLKEKLKELNPKLSNIPYPKNR